MLTDLMKPIARRGITVLTALSFLGTGCSRDNKPILVDAWYDINRDGVEDAIIAEPVRNAGENILWIDGTQVKRVGNSEIEIPKGTPRNRMAGVMYGARGIPENTQVQIREVDRGMYTIYTTWQASDGSAKESQPAVYIWELK